jgi:hypothetical protein
MWNTKKKKNKYQLLRDEIDSLYEEISAMWYTIEELKENKKQWLELESIRHDFYEEIDDLWFKVYKLGRNKDDLPRVSQSRGCIKIIL